MRDFYAISASAPLDQAHGLRQMFAGQSRCVLALVANPHVALGSLVLDRLTARLAAMGRRVLLVDAAATAPLPSELVSLDLAAGIVPFAPGVAYLAARGLPPKFVDTRGSSARFIEALSDAAPGADVLLLHAEASDLVRMLARRAARPLIIGADHPESVKHAYAACKLLLARTGLATFDLLLAASSHSPRVASIADSLSRCADSFLGALLHDWVLIDPAGNDADPAEAGLTRLLAAQLALDHLSPAPGAAATRAPLRAALRAAHR